MRPGVGLGSPHHQGHCADLQHGLPPTHPVLRDALLLGTPAHVNCSTGSNHRPRRSMVQLTTSIAIFESCDVH